MTALLAFAALVAIAYVILEHGCRPTPPPAGIPWQYVYPHLRISKKKRTRGEVNHQGRTRREQAHAPVP